MEVNIKKKIRGKPFKKGFTPWHKGTKGLITSWNKGNIGYRKGIRRTPVGFKHSEETIEKMRLAHKNKITYNYKGGKPNCVECGKKLSTYINKTGMCFDCYSKTEYRKINCVRGGISSIIKLHNKNGPNNLEKIVYDELKRRGIIFETERKINNKFVVDVYIPKSNTIIEIDGKYWHGLENIVIKDKSENAYLTKCGFNLIRLSENDVKQRNFISLTEA